MDILSTFEERVSTRKKTSVLLFRERLSEKMCTRQSRKVIWDMTREDKGDREGIPHTHPFPQVIRLELVLESG